MALNPIRDKDLFEKDECPEAKPPKPFRFYLRNTPADPLPAGTKALLWVAGVVVAAMMVLVLLAGARGPLAKVGPGEHGATTSSSSMDS